MEKIKKMEKSDSFNYGKMRYEKLKKTKSVRTVAVKVEKVLKKKPRLYSFFHNAGKISLIKK